MRAPLPLLLAFTLTACGGGTPAGPTVLPGSAVQLTVFEDENGDGVAQPHEAGRVPGVTVEVAGRAGVSAAGSGQVTVGGVPAGTFGVTVRGLPPFYRLGAVRPVTAPQPAGQQHAVPLTLPIGNNRPHLYMAFGDSITEGDGSSDGRGYLDRLQVRLGQGFGPAEVFADAIAGTRTADGAARIAASLRRERPAYTLVMYGTNDWNEKRECRWTDDCPTVDNLRGMVRDVLWAHSLPVLATIPPSNLGFDTRATPERNAWVASTNERVRAMAREEGAALADVHAAFVSAGDLAGLFVDHVHPSDRGYDLIAQAFYEAISRPAGTGSSAASLPAWFAPPAPPR